MLLTQQLRDNPTQKRHEKRSGSSYFGDNYAQLANNDIALANNNRKLSHNDLRHRHKYIHIAIDELQFGDNDIPLANNDLQNANNDLQNANNALQNANDDQYNVQNALQPMNKLWQSGQSEKNVQEEKRSGYHFYSAYPSINLQALLKNLFVANAEIPRCAENTDVAVVIHSKLSWKKDADSLLSIRYPRLRKVST